jgi:hypothetical protein
MNHPDNDNGNGNEAKQSDTHFSGMEDIFAELAKSRDC